MCFKRVFLNFYIVIGFFRGVFIMVCVFFRVILVSGRLFRVFGFSDYRLF